MGTLDYGVILEHQCQISDEIPFVWGSWGQRQFHLSSDIDIFASVIRTAQLVYGQRK